LPSGDAAITTPCSAATSRRPVTANSLAMITIATQAANRLSDTNKMNSTMINSLSAIESINFPKIIILPRERTK